MANLPLLPGYTFQDFHQSYHLPHKLDISNGFPMVYDTNFGIGKRPIDAASAAYVGMPDPVQYDPSLTYGRVPRYVYRQFVPDYALFAQKCLCFKAFFHQTVFNSPNEHYRVRYINIIYFLEDNTLCVIEPLIENVGFNQGKLVRREKIPKNNKGDLFTWKDFNIGIDICIHGVTYHIVDCDPFTREFLRSQGVDVGDKKSFPADPYTELRKINNDRTPWLKSTADDSKRYFLKYDRMVLSFVATSNDDRYHVMYFLADNTMAIREIHEPNDGKDPVTMLLKRMRVPKNWENLSSWYPKIDYEDSEIIEYYSPRDFKLGETISVFGRCFLLHDCDPFTHKYYTDVLGAPQPSAIPFPAKMERSVPKYKVPPHIDYGRPEDTYASCLSLVPKPFKKNVIRQLANFPKRLRYSVRMDAAHPEDENRNFVLEYDLSNGAIRINEIERSNSGRREGCFLGWRPIPKPATGKDDPRYYTPEDFFIGAHINVFNHHFVITGADLFVYRYVEANNDKFCQEVRDNLRNYFLPQEQRDNEDVGTEERQLENVTTKNNKGGVKFEGDTPDVEKLI